jgi:hypothetical protein
VTDQTTKELLVQGVPEISVVGVEELLTNARRLGLLQTYRPGTVYESPSDLTQVMVTLDGDLEPIRAQSLAGGVLEGSRVMVMTVPPQGVYIIGFVGIGGFASVKPFQTLITATGAGTFAGVPGAVYHQIELVGGGGAGGGAALAAAGQNSKGSGGGGGAYARSRINAADLTYPVAYVVGAGGTGVSGAAGNAGANTTFDTTLITAPGGGGGGIALSSAAAGFGVQGGRGGATGVGDLVIGGAGGGFGMGSATLGAGGHGGDSVLGSGSAGRASASAAASLAGLPGGQYGGAGSGAATNAGGGAQPGGDGAAGVIIITSFFH